MDKLFNRLCRYFTIKTVTLLLFMFNQKTIYGTQKHTRTLLIIKAFIPPATSSTFEKRHIQILLIVIR